VQQYFEHGTAIWIKENDLTFILFNTSLRAGSFVEGSAESYRGGIDLALHRNPYIRGKLGRAIDEETTFRTIKQSITKGCTKHFSIYLRAADGSVFDIFDAYDGLYWKKVQAKDDD
jgi:hypothetical protein